jgi:hypothetical protein
MYYYFPVVYNILNHERKQNIVFEDKHPQTGFCSFARNLSGTDQRRVYLVAIVHAKLKSIRDLSAEHLPLLEAFYIKDPVQNWKKDIVFEEWLTVMTTLEGLVPNLGFPSP